MVVYIICIQAIMEEYIMDYENNLHSSTESKDNQIEDQHNRFRPENIKRYAFIFFWMVVAIVVAVYIIFNGNSLVHKIYEFLAILEPIVFGLIFAYLLNPSVKFFERILFDPLMVNMKNRKKAESLSRGLSITISVVIFLLIVTILLNMVIPELYNTVLNLVNIVPKQTANLTNWINGYLLTDDSISQYLKSAINQFNDFLPKWIQNDLLNTVSSLTVGVIGALQTLLNVFIGLAVSIYVLISKERFTGQAKKIVYSIFNPQKANTFLRTAHKSNEIFINFFCGKLVEAAIMGVLCFIGCSILQLPYAMLVSVIIGVTNIIPFFGPYIGGIPSIFLILLDDPIKGITFTIFLVCLVQLDGNLIGPKILGDSIGLSAFWIIFSILMGGGLFGFPGLLFGVPTFAVIYYIVGQIVAQRLHKKKLPIPYDEYVDLKSIDTKTGKMEYFSKEESESSSYFSSLFKKKPKK